MCHEYLGHREFPTLSVKITRSLSRRENYLFIQEGRSLELIYSYMTYKVKEVLNVRDNSVAVTSRNVNVISPCAFMVMRGRLRPHWDSWTAHAQAVSGRLGSA